MSNLTKRKALRMSIADVLVIYCHDHVLQRRGAIDDIEKLINSEVLKALSDLKSKTQHMTEYEDNTSYDAVPLSAIEEIESRYV